MSRLLIILPLIFFLNVSYAQEREDVLGHSISFENTTLKKALERISETYGIMFSYSDSRLDVAKEVSGSFTGSSPELLVHHFLSQFNIEYNVIDHRFVLLPHEKSSMFNIEGRVLNAKDQSPIPFAHIQVVNAKFGTATNQDGDFSLRTAHLPIELKISHLNFEDKSIFIYDQEQEVTISLSPAKIELQEVKVQAKKSENAYYRMVRKALEKIQKSTQNLQYGKAFYRQKTSRDNSFTEIFEMFYDVKYNLNTIEDWAVEEGRYAFQNSDGNDIFLYNKNFTLLTRLFPLMQPETDSYILPIQQEVKQHYTLSLENIISVNDRYVAIINYEPKNSTRGNLAKGQIYIDYKDYSILKYTGAFSDSDLDIVGFSDKRSSWDNHTLRFEVSYLESSDQPLMLDYVQVDHSFDYLFQGESIGKVHTHSMLKFYEHYAPPENKNLGGQLSFEQSDREVIDHIGYNPSFWKNNPIVKRTPLEESLIEAFEKDKAFGIVLLNDSVYV